MNKFLRHFLYNFCIKINMLTCNYNLVATRERERERERESKSSLVVFKLGGITL